jgi:hypothetical protein
VIVRHVVGDNADRHVEQCICVVVGHPGPFAPLSFAVRDRR